MAGDLRARALPVWDQQSWDGVTWLDAVGPSGPASASYNDAELTSSLRNAAGAPIQGLRDGNRLPTLDVLLDEAELPITR